MVDFLKINIDKGLTVFYLKNRDNLYLGNIVVYRPDKFCIKNMDLEEVKKTVNGQLNGLYKNIERVENSLVLNNSMRSCLCTYPESAHITVDGGLDIKLENNEIMVLENVSSDLIEIKSDKTNEVYHLFYLQKPLVELRRKVKRAIGAGIGIGAGAGAGLGLGVRETLLLV